MGASHACCSSNVQLPAFLFPFLPTLSLGKHLDLVSILVGKYSTDFVSVMVPGGCRSQGCHGYLRIC